MSKNRFMGGLNGDFGFRQKKSWKILGKWRTFFNETFLFDFL